MSTIKYITLLTMFFSYSHIHTAANTEPCENLTGLCSSELGELLERIYHLIPENGNTQTSSEQDIKTTVSDLDVLSLRLRRHTSFLDECESREAIQNIFLSLFGLTTEIVKSITKVYQIISEPCFVERKGLLLLSSGVRILKWSLDDLIAKVTAEHLA